MRDEFLFDPVIPTVEVEGTSRRFPVRRIICVGRNYAAHAREMGKDPDREPPFFFLKPGDTIVASDSAIAYPPMTTNLHYEIELVVAIGKAGANVQPHAALELVYGYAVGIDLTRRDLQLQARNAGRPWDWGKGFDYSAPCSRIVPGDRLGHPVKGRIWLAVNGEVKQDADISDLIWDVPEIIAFASQAMKLAPGDLIYTGTPAGVGPIAIGDRVTGGVAEIGEISITVANTA
jgi:fumarylpyruvate hydrolase